MSSRINQNMGGKVLAGRTGFSPQAEPRLFQGERLLVGVGMLGLLLGAIVALLILVRQDPFIPPEGNLAGVRDFLLAVGIYTITIAAFLPLSGFNARQRSRFRWALAGLTLYFYAAELVPPLFGQDPRFSPVPVFAVFGILFGIASLFLAAAYVRFTVSLFRSTTPRRLLLAGVRYGMLASLLAVLGGVLMGTVFAGRYIGEGNLLVSHAVGFHGLQAVPLVAWLLEHSRISFTVAFRWLHAAGISWLAMTALTFTQALVGSAPLEPTVFLGAAVVFAAVWLGSLAFAVAAWTHGLRAQEKVVASPAE